MSGYGHFDIRLPIGTLFSVLGVILVGYGVTTWSDAGLYLRSESIDINFWWGVIMLIFGGTMLFFGRRAMKRALPTAAGAETEAREHRLGLERER
jgi:protein-S-isoprenylcysteine O-methyltransferase Ste14